MLQHRRTLLYFICWWLAWMIIQAFAISQAGFGWTLAAVDAAVSVTLIGLESYALLMMLRFYLPSPRNALNLLAWSLALSVLTSAVTTGILQWVMPAPYGDFISSSLPVRFSFSFFMIVFIALLGWLWFFMQAQQEDKDRKTAAEKLARDAELSTLRQQLQPHFLFNSLNSINALILANPEKARTMVHQLSDFFRGTLRKDENQLVTLEEELQQLQLYLEIEKVRFGHRLATRVDVDEDTRKMKVPLLFLQPVVENAIKFGLYDTTGEVTILVETRRKPDGLQVCVENPFDKETATPRKGAGFGLSSIQRRLYLLYGRNDLLVTQQEDGKFKTCITVPQ